MNVLNFSLFIVVIFVAVISAKDHVPVLLWSSKLEVPPVSSLKHLAAAQFSQLLQDGTKSKPNVVVFLESSLSVEDFWVKAENEAPVYHHLSKKLTGIDTDFLPSVSNPMKAIHLLRDGGYDWIHYSGRVPSDLKKPTVILVSLEDISSIQDRHEILRAHDKKIAHIYDQVEKHYPHTLALYSGRRDAWLEAEKISNRVRRADKAEEEGEEPYDGVVIVKDQIAIIANSITYYANKDSPPQNLSEVTDMSVVNETENLALKVTFNGGVIVTFTFDADVSPVGQWLLLSVTVDEKTLTPPETVWAPNSWSYYCGKITFQNLEDTKIEFLGLQAQPNVNGEFGDPIDCVPYFSMAIWSGIIISALLLFIMAWGITMLMDINTNDRFDDPKGKTITINAVD